MASFPVEYPWQIKKKAFNVKTDCLMYEPQVGQEFVSVSIGHMDNSENSKCVLLC